MTSNPRALVTLPAGRIRALLAEFDHPAGINSQRSDQSRRVGCKPTIFRPTDFRPAHHQPGPTTSAPNPMGRDYPWMDMVPRPPLRSGSL